MTRVLMISGDPKLLDKDSFVAKRHAEYARLFEELSILVVGVKLPKVSYRLSENTFVYGVSARTKIGAFFSSIFIGKRLLGREASKWVVTAQDPFELGLIAWAISKLTGTRLHLQIHTDFLSTYFAKHSLRNRFRILKAKFLLPRAHGIRVVSKRISDSLTAKSLKLKSFPVILPIFTDIEKFNNASITTDLRTKYPQFDRIIFMVGRLEKEKNFPLALSVMTKVLEKYPKTGLVIVGDGSQRQSLERIVAESSLSSKVIFEGAQDDLVSYYKTADVLLLTSEYEGYGLVLEEASASNLPIVSTDVGIAREIGVDACPVGDGECLANKILSFFAGTFSPPKTHPISMTKELYLEGYKTTIERCMLKDI